MRMYDIIEKKRDGMKLSIDEIVYFINGYTSGNIPDYQASALLMAIFIKGMDADETSYLTHAMAHSGDTVDLSSIEGIKVDKHSTGGVGDKTSLILAPIVAACGVPVAKMSGRGLGHTGGTIDKLEAIPGFTTSLTKEGFLQNVRNIGIAIAGQTGNLAPADKKLYALRDVTATVNNISLIASSIMSKKIAAGADKIVLDVKTGSGAFMKTVDDSIALAMEMVKIGEGVGRETIAIVTDMDVPLGNAVGNSLEIIEAIYALKGKGPSDLMEVSLALAASMLELGGKGSPSECKILARNAIEDGTALLKFKQMLQLQGADPQVTDNYELLGKASYTHDVIANEDGYVQAIITDLLGKAALELGAGRETKESVIDYTAGLYLHKKTGEQISKGEKLVSLYSNSREKLLTAEILVKSAYIISQVKPTVRPLIIAMIKGSEVIMF